MLHRTHNVGRDLQEQLNRQDYNTKISITKLGHNQGLFRIKVLGVQV